MILEDMYKGDEVMRSRCSMRQLDKHISTDSRRSHYPCTWRTVGLLSKWLLSGLVAVSMAACGGEYPTDGIEPIDETTDIESADSGMTKSQWQFARNADVRGDFFYVRDGKGRKLKNRRVDNNDSIVVLDVGYTSQLTLVQYPTRNGPRIGFIKNVPSLIKYYAQDEWQNGSTPETVYDLNGKKIGLLNPHEKATPLYISPFNGMFHVVYDTNKGPNTKSGYVKYHGNFPAFKPSPIPPIGPLCLGGSGPQPGSSSSCSSGGITMDDLITIAKDFLDLAGCFINDLPPVLVPAPVLEKARYNYNSTCPLEV